MGFGIDDAVAARRPGRPPDVAVGPLEVGELASLVRAASWAPRDHESTAFSARISSGRTTIPSTTGMSFNASGYIVFQR